MYRKASIKPPLPPQISPFPLISPPPSLIVCDRKTSCGLTQNGLFTNWKFGFDSDPRLHDLTLLVLELFHFAFQFFLEN